MHREAYELTVPADPASLKEVRGHFRPILAPLAGDRVDDLLLAIDEACSNVIKHRRADPDGGPPDDLNLRVETDPSLRLVMRLPAFCAESDRAKVKPRDLDDVRPGGLGMHFIAEIMDCVSLDPDPNRPGMLMLTMEKALDPGRSAERPSGTGGTGDA
ncbi:MAG: ATP-binding protein [Planctomycetota bacterium]